MAIAGSEVMPVPSWIRIIRGVQLLFGVVIFALACYGVHWIAFACWGFAIFVSLFTFLVVIYELVTTNIPSAHGLYNHFIIIGTNALLTIFWLSAMGDIAATRAIFRYPTEVDGCFNTGGIGGGVCYKRALAPRDTIYIATNGYLAIMVVAAILAAVEFILFALCTVMYILTWNKQRVAAINTHPTPGKVEAHQMAPQQQYNEVPQQQQAYTQQQQFVPASTQPYVQPTQHAPAQQY